ncbi:cytochrome c3 family protein [Pseudoalteromonas denitrificans]|jgi:cytochrome c-type protein NapC|uniref:Cytochrome c-type protein n=1 Tax=Pseudoalteromonas denitrificans DSM 6059 TaxID=1123010 RepID=A0A1I1E2Q2_9GAMM|nr:cytochrome c3 family protein [Pseudoalteromonas denitrificans]SFB81354.1 cytochrome c-type protein NapC [Pseudoalteromonas denitrificans DSM 6059]
MNMLKKIWQILKTPTSAAVGFVIALGFVGGVVFWGGFNTTLELTNTEEFCIGCHEMGDNVYQEYKETIHYANRSGVRATCPDCHVPKDWTHKIIRKIAASKEVWGKMTGIIDTREKFQDHRKSMAMREWKRMKDNDSRECRNCHNFEYMDFSEQGSRSVKMHSTALASGEKTCIDCHKGIAHELPDMEGVEGWH